MNPHPSYKYTNKQNNSKLESNYFEILIISRRDITKPLSLYF